MDGQLDRQTDEHQTLICPDDNVLYCTARE